MKINNPIEGGLSTLAEMATGCAKSAILREDMFRTELDNAIIDTCIAFDTNEWETGINRGGDWIIVEQYSTRDKAKKGHNKWLKKLKTNPDIKLKCLNLWNF